MVELGWESAARTYAIEVSADGETWKEVVRNDKGQGGVETLRFGPAEARWVRMHGLKRASKFGFSLWEFKVFADGN